MFQNAAVTPKRYSSEMEAKLANTDEYANPPSISRDRSDVEMRCETLEKRAYHLQETVAVLAGRLSALTVPEVAMPGAGRLETAEALCPLSVKLRDIEELLASVNGELHSILNRLQI